MHTQACRARGARSPDRVALQLLAIADQQEGARTARLTIEALERFSDRLLQVAAGSGHRAGNRRFESARDDAVVSGQGSDRKGLSREDHQADPIPAQSGQQAFDGVCRHGEPVRPGGIRGEHRA